MVIPRLPLQEAMCLQQAISQSQWMICHFRPPTTDHRPQTTNFSISKFQFNIKDASLTRHFFLWMICCPYSVLGGPWSLFSGLSSIFPKFELHTVQLKLTICICQIQEENF